MTSASREEILVSVDAASGSSRLGRQLLSVLLTDRPRALARLALVLAHRQVELIGLAASGSVDGFAAVSVEVDVADDAELARIVKFLNRCVDVVKVVHLDQDLTHQREAVLVKLACPPADRGAVIDLAVSLSAEVIEVSPTTVTVFRSDTPQRIATLLDVLHTIGIREVSRSASFGILRGSRTVTTAARHARAGYLEPGPAQPVLTEQP